MSGFVNIRDRTAPWEDYKSSNVEYCRSNDDGCISMVQLELQMYHGHRHAIDIKSCVMCP